MAATKKTTAESTAKKEVEKKKVTKKAPAKKDVVVQEVKEEVVEAENKEAEEKKEAAKKKAPAKKTTTKKVPKNVYVEYYGTQMKLDVDEYEEKVKDLWLNDWKRLAKDLKEIDLYIKPEDGKVYFVINGTEHGAVEL